MSHNPGEMPQSSALLKARIEQINDLFDDIRPELDLIIAALKARGNPPEPATSVLRIEGVEMTQSTQFYDLNGQGSDNESNNMVPLIAGKDLIVRVYVGRSAGFAIREADRFDGVLSYRGKQIRSLNGPIRLHDTPALRRTRVDDSLNFRIPSADCHGTINFRVTVSQSPPSVFNNSTGKFYATFHSIPRMRVAGVRVRFTGNGQNWPAPSWLDLVSTLNRFLPMLPTPGIDYLPSTVIEYDGDLTTASGWDTLVNTLANLRSASTQGAFFVGLLPANVATMASVAQRGIGDTGLAVACDDDTRAMSHELGHACTLKHLDFNGAPEPFDERYPSYGAFPDFSIGEVGIDTNRPSWSTHLGLVRSEPLVPYDPATSYDFMTYNENWGAPPLYTNSTWISPYHYKKMMNFIRTTDGTGRVVILGRVTVAAIAMLLNFRVHRSGEVEVLPSYPVTGVAASGDLRPTSPVLVDLYDRGGRWLGAHRCHQHNPYQDKDAAYLDFHEVIPWREDIETLAVSRGREELHRVAVHDTAPPAIEALDVQQEDDSGSARVECRVDEALAGALLRYSPDGGRTWYAVAEHLGGKQARVRYLVDLSGLPGGEDCRVEVIGSNGLAASSAQSEPFRVPRRPRRVHLFAPPDGAAFAAGAPVQLSGTALSPDHDTPPGDRLVWTSSLDGMLGVGADLVVASLHPGRHRITLTAPQDDDCSAEVSAAVCVEVAGPESDEDFRDQPG